MNQIFPGFKLTDPVWRTIARKSQSPVSLVYAVYLLLYEDATPDGDLQTMPEDIATALDENETDILNIIEEMDGRVVSGSHLMHFDPEDQ